MQVPTPASPPAKAPASTQFVTRERHAPLCWHRPAHYLAAAGQVLAPIASFEAPVAASRLPLALVDQGGRWVLVAVLGLPKGVNLCVAPDGRWTGPYTPAIFRAAPFTLQPAPDGRLLLAIDEQAGQVRQAGPGGGGEPFFAADGTLTPLVQQMLKFLTRIAQGGQAMERACAALHAQDLLVPWTVSFQSPGGDPQPVRGLWRVDEAALRQLPGEALQALMQAGALALAYSQLLSVQHLALLGEWSRARAIAEAPVAPPAQGVQGDAGWQAPDALTSALGDLDLEFLSKSDTLRFDKL